MGQKQSKSRREEQRGKENAGGEATDGSAAGSRQQPSPVPTTGTGAGAGGVTRTVSRRLRGWSEALPPIANKRASKSDDHLKRIAHSWKADVKDIWGRAVEDLPIHTDLPRIGGKVAVFNRGGAEVPVTVTDDSTAAMVVGLLATIEAAAVEQPDAASSAADRCRAAVGPQILDDAPKNVGEGEGEGGEGEESEGGESGRKSAASGAAGDLAERLRGVLSSPHLSPSTLACLRAIHQRVMFPAYYNIKNRLGGDEQLRDKRGHWFVRVDFLPAPSPSITSPSEATAAEGVDGDEAKEEAGVGGIVVRHRKGQRSANVVERKGAATAAEDANGDVEPPAEYEFEWELVIRIDASLNRVGHVELLTRDLVFHPDVAADRRLLIETRLEHGRDPSRKEIKKMKRSQKDAAKKTKQTDAPKGGGNGPIIEQVIEE